MNGVGSLAVAAVFPFVAVAADLSPLAIHGALSATGGYSDRYNYLGETKDNFDVYSNEVTVNGTHRFANGLRFGAQIYGYKLNRYRDLTLDFASLDYAFNERCGVRVGRSKQAVGLYGDTQDIDLIRPVALLPLEVYPKAMRSYGAAYDGAAVYGNVPVSGLGSLDYHVYGGKPARYRSDDPWLAITNDSAPITVTDVQDVGRLVAGSLYWNTPVEGLRLGASATRTTGGKLAGVVRPASEVALIASDTRLAVHALPPGMWDRLLAGAPGSGTIDAASQIFASTEYVRGAWSFSGEYMVQPVHASATLPLIGTSPVIYRTASAYGMATWQAQPKLQFAAYYAYSVGDTHDRHGEKNVAVPAHRAWQKDTAVAASYSLASWWLVKAQVDFLNGTEVLTGSLNVDAARWQANWMLLTLKSTISF